MNKEKEKQYRFYTLAVQLYVGAGIWFLCGTAMAVIALVYFLFNVF